MPPKTLALMVIAVASLLVLAGCGKLAQTVTPTPSDASGPQRVELGQAFEMKVDERVEILRHPGTASLWFRQVKNDSRCPSDVVCVRAGDATVEMTGFGSDGQGTEIALVVDSGDSATAQFDNLFLTVTHLLPYPVSTKPIQPGEYHATVVVRSQE